MKGEFTLSVFAKHFFFSLLKFISLYSLLFAILFGFVNYSETGSIGWSRFVSLWQDSLDLLLPALIVIGSACVAWAGATRKAGPAEKSVLWILFGAALISFFPGVAAGFAMGGDESVAAIMIGWFALFVITSIFTLFAWVILPIYPDWLY